MICASVKKAVQNQPADSTSDVHSIIQLRVRWAAAKRTGNSLINGSLGEVRRCFRPQGLSQPSSRLLDGQF